MKKYILSILAIIAVMSYSWVAATVMTAGFETQYTTAALNLRSEPTTAGDILTTYPKGQALDIIGTNGGDWWEVWDGTVQGWVNKAYMSPYAENGAFTYHGHSDTPICAVTVTQYGTSPAENGGYTTTAMGDNLIDVVGLCIAADPRVLPMNSKVYIDGVGYRTVRDVGGGIKGAHVDLLVWNIDYGWSVTAWHNVYEAW